jgi:5-methylcytosine-specific restriction enzyme A
MTRPHMSARRREHLFHLHLGLCHRCALAIDPVRERFEIGHVIPWAISRDDSDENCQPEHYTCHRAHTNEVDIPLIAKVKRQYRNHNGFRVSARPMPGSKASPFRKRMDGTVEKRWK